MSNIQIIEELCGICSDLAGIVREQQEILAQHDALALEEQIAQVRDRYTALIGRDEWPGELPGEPGETPGELDVPDE